MAYAFECDRCGKLIKGSIKQKVTFEDGILNNKNVRVSYWELCGECSSLLEYFFRVVSEPDKVVLDPIIPLRTKVNPDSNQF